MMFERKVVKDKFGDNRRAVLANGTPVAYMNSQVDSLVEAWLTPDEQVRLAVRAFLRGESRAAEDAYQRYLRATLPSGESDDARRHRLGIELPGMKNSF